MNQRMTEQAIKTIMLAQQEARRTDRAFVGTEQILIGLIDEASGIAAQVLTSKGIDRTRVVMETEKIIGARGPGTNPLEMPFTPRAKRNLELAWDEARRLGHNYVGTEHLLLALIRLQEGGGAVVLGNMNVDLEQLQTDLIALIKETSNDDGRHFSSFVYPSFSTLRHAASSPSAFGPAIQRRVSISLLRRLHHRHGCQSCGQKPPTVVDAAFKSMRVIECFDFAEQPRFYISRVQVLDFNQL
jgi:ATP-dependent Clp protease ATP-binding subunit ClpC